MAKEKIDISIQEKQEIQGKATQELHQDLAKAQEQINEINEEKKADPHLNELKLELRDINGNYKERIELAAAKRNYIIQILKTRREV